MTGIQEFGVKMALAVFMVSCDSSGGGAGAKDTGANDAAAPEEANDAGANEDASAKDTGYASDFVAAESVVAEDLSSAHDSDNGVICGSPQASVNGPLVIRTESEFSAMAGVQNVNGDLTITPDTEIYTNHSAPFGELDLSMFKCLAHVTGTLNIILNGSNTVVGFSGLQDVGGEFKVSGAIEEIQFAGLSHVGSMTAGGGMVENIDCPALTTINANFKMEYNFSTTSLSGLSNLASVGGLFQLYGNTALSTLGLTALTSIGGTLDIRGNLELPCQLACDLASASSPAEVMIGINNAAPEPNPAAMR